MNPKLLSINLMIHLFSEIDVLIILYKLKYVLITIMLKDIIALEINFIQ